MARKLIFMTTVIMAVAFSGGIGWAVDQDQSMGQERNIEQERLRDQDIYGWELMTVEERESHRNRMHSLKTEQEREQYRQEHHEQMQERARAQGRTLPDMDMPAGGGQGAGAAGGN